VSGDPGLAARLASKLRLPVMAGPMFIASTPALVVAQCRSGIIGSMPALNPRTTAALDADISTIERELEGCEVPYAINLVAHRTNARLDADIEAVHAYGGLVFNDVANDRHAHKCAEMGVDGIIAIAAGAGGHTGSLSPFALIQEIREWWNGLLLLAGCIATGRAILAAETLGADLAYIGSPFLASLEANTQPAFKQMVVESGSKDIIVTKGFTGARASFLAPSLLANGLDPEALAKKESAGVDISDGGSNSKAWRDIWSAGQGIGAVKSAQSAADYIDALKADYLRARQAMSARLS
jgi:nitronate monooxygenase